MFLLKTNQNCFKPLCFVFQLTYICTLQTNTLSESIYNSRESYQQEGWIKFGKNDPHIFKFSHQGRFFSKLIENVSNLYISLHMHPYLHCAKGQVFRGHLQVKGEPLVGGYPHLGENHVFFIAMRRAVKCQIIKIHNSPSVLLQKT